MSLLASLIVEARVCHRDRSARERGAHGRIGPVVLQDRGDPLADDLPEPGGLVCHGEGLAGSELEEPQFFRAPHTAHTARPPGFSTRSIS